MQRKKGEGKAKRRDPAVTSKIMAAVRGKDTRPEVALRQALHSRGLRFRVHYGRVPGRPDIVFPRRKLAVFIDGDFWHGNSWRARGFGSLKDQLERWRNASFWTAKIRGNMRRDKQVNRQLRRLGWTVLRFWESDLGKRLRSCVRTVEVALKRTA
jgi:DNA mismatch endonuclease (patch repair protein)